MKRIAQLDGIRGIAILLVVVWHYFVCQVVAEPKSLMAACLRALSLTWSGVDLFFVLSGFLIAGILLDNRNSASIFRVFYVRRICRIFPLYFLILGLFVCLAAIPTFQAPWFQWLFHDPMPLWSYASFTQNVFMGVRGDFGPHWLGITWSLAVEEQFYLVVPLLVCFLPRRALVWVFGLAIVSAPILRYMFPGFIAFVNTPWRSDSLISGALLAVCVRWQPFAFHVRQYRRVVLFSLGVLLLGAAVMTLRSDVFGVFNHLWLAALYSTFILIAFVGSEPWLGTLLESPLLVWFGQLSYGIYMFHEAVNGILHGLIRHSSPQIRTFSEAGVTLASLSITLALATLSYRFFEGPFLRFGHRFKYSPRHSRELAVQAMSTVG